MKKLFKKAMTIAGSVVLIGMTVGAASAAASYPTPFTSNTAVVVGTGLGVNDAAAASSIVSNLQSLAPAEAATTTLTGASGVTENDVALGSVINASGYKIKTEMKHSKISSLRDDKMSWDNGDGSDNYNYHEAIRIGGNMSVLTSLHDKDLAGVALSNDMALQYRYYFDDAIPISSSNPDNADDLYLTILGQSYQVTNITNTTISVVTSKEISAKKGDSVTVQGQTFKVDDLSKDSVKINGEVVANGKSKKIDGLQVEVEYGSIFYNDNTPDEASATLRIGKDISKTYSDGDAYIGQNEDDPLWVWTIHNAATDGGYIGVKYNADIEYADDNDANASIKYVGQSYILPENFGAVKLDGLTNVSYEDAKISFNDVDLYNSSDSGTASRKKKVIVISGDSDDSVTTADGAKDSRELYLYYQKAGSDFAGDDAAGNNGSIQVYYKDVNGDNTPTNKARYEQEFNLTAPKTMGPATVGTITVGDSIVPIQASVTDGSMTLSFDNPSDATDGVNGGHIDLNISGTTLSATDGTFERLGPNADSADAHDISVNGTDVSTKEESIMNHYGIVVAKDDSDGVKGNADNDEVTLSIPSDQVYATVSVVAGGEATTSPTTTDAGVITLKDTETSAMSGKNLIVVGGPAINSVAASLLKVPYPTSGSAFTDATGISAGKFLIESFDHSGNTALLVAGYNADDTGRAVTYLTNENVNTTHGNKYTGTSGTQATLTVA